jgi:hypothetical protein
MVQVGHFEVPHLAHMTQIGSGGLTRGLNLTGPRFGSQAVDLPVGGVRQPGEDVAQIGLGIDAATAAAFDDGIKDGAALADLGFADKQPVLFRGQLAGSHFPRCSGRSRRGRHRGRRRAGAIGSAHNREPAPYRCEAGSAASF